MIWWAPILLFQISQALDLPAVEKNPFTSPADVSAGKRLYAGRCGGCHGPTGDGGKGANLGVPVLPRAADDRTLYRVIRYGLTETEMPGTYLTQRELWQVVAFVRTLGQVERGPVTGDAARGEELLRGKGGCLQCHSIGMEGSQMAPPLTEIGSRRGPGHLRGKLLDPASDMPDQYRMVELATKDGKKFNGIRLNEDTWSIQARDFSGKPHTFEKQDLTELRVVRRTPMPSYRERLDGREIDDVVAYLSGLRSNP